MFSPAFGLVLLATLVAVDKAPKYPTLDKLAAEAKDLKARQPDRWKHYQEQAERVFAENQKVRANWKRRSAPPRPDLTPLKLPLAFLVDALRREEKLRAAPPPRQASGRHYAYLRAVARSADERRIPALLEYRDHFLGLGPENAKRYSRGAILAEAATPRWAAAQIPRLAGRNPPLDYTRRGDNLLYCLIDRFAGELPADVRRVAFAYLRGQSPGGPTGHDSERVWDLLFRLDAPRARKEILPYFATPSGAALRYNYHVPVLLERHAGPSPEVAAAVRRWLADQKDLTEYNRRQLRAVLLRADPAKELEPAVRHIDQLLAEQKRTHARFAFGGDVHLLVLAMGEVRTKAAAGHLARYAFEPAIDGGVRFLILESLVRQRCPKAPALVARWLAEEPEPMRRHLRKEAKEKWGAYGRQVLAEAERLNAPKGP